MSHQRTGSLTRNSPPTQVHSIAVAPAAAANHGDGNGDGHGGGGPPAPKTPPLAHGHIHGHGHHHHHGHGSSNGASHRRWLILSISIVGAFLIFLNWARLSSIYSQHIYRHHSSSSLPPMPPSSPLPVDTSSAVDTIEASMNDTNRIAQQLASLGNDGITRLKQLTSDLRELREQLNEGSASSSSQSPTLPNQDVNTNTGIIEAPKPNQTLVVSPVQSIPSSPVTTTTTTTTTTPVTKPSVGKGASRPAPPPPKPMYIPPSAAPPDIPSNILTMDTFNDFFQLIVKVFTVDQHAERLTKTLTSLLDADYNGDTNIVLEIFVDRHQAFDPKNSTLLNVVRQFKWPFGQKYVYVQDAPAGKLGQWTGQLIGFLFNAFQ
jgi:hypothetical protein